MGVRQFCQLIGLLKATTKSTSQVVVEMQI